MKPTGPEATHYLAGLAGYASSGIAPFHTPGHRQGRFVDPAFKDMLGERLFQLDVSDVVQSEAFGDKYHACFRAAQEEAARVFGAARSFFLVNGTTVGILALFLACAGWGEVVVPRQCHRSLISGLVLSREKPLYYDCRYHSDFAIFGEPDEESLYSAIAAANAAPVVWVTRPTYHGLLSDLRPLAEKVHRLGGLLLVDEAHGAHFHLPANLPSPALRQGADAVVQSTHKWLSALTGASMLHLGTTKGAAQIASRLENALQILQTTSPSPILLASLDACTRHVATLARQGMRFFTEKALALRTNVAAQSGLKVMDESSIGPGPLVRSTAERRKTGRTPVEPGETYRLLSEESDLPSEPAVDPWRLTINVAATGLTGREAACTLRSEHGIQVEFGDMLNIVVFLSPGDPALHWERLLTSLVQLAGRRGSLPARVRDAVSLFAALPVAEAPVAPGAAFSAAGRVIPVSQAGGHVAADIVCPYPPGIPLLRPGEIVAKEHIQLTNLCVELGWEVHGIYLQQDGEPLLRVAY